MYSIVDLEGYIDACRTEAALNYSDSCDEDLDTYITLNQARYIVDSYSLGFDENDNYIIDEDIHFDIVEEIQQWILEAGLAKLAAENKIECAWDDSLNTMVFWYPDNKNDKTTNSRTEDGDR